MKRLSQITWTLIGVMVSVFVLMVLAAEFMRGVTNPPH